jgi:hypothetical protein
MNSPCREDLKTVAAHLKKTGLFRAYKFRVPGNIEDSPLKCGILGGNSKNKRRKSTMNTPIT